MKALATAALAALLAACSSTAACGLQWEFGTPLQAHTHGGELSSWGNGPALALAAAWPVGGDAQFVLRTSYRAAPFKKWRGFEPSGAPEATCSERTGDYSHFFMVEATVRLFPIGSRRGYMGISVGALLIDVGDTRRICEDTHGSLPYTDVRTGAPEELGFVSASLGLILGRPPSRCVVLELESGVVSDGRGFWVSAGPSVWFRT